MKCMIYTHIHTSPQNAIAPDFKFVGIFKKKYSEIKTFKMIIF